MARTTLTLETLGDLSDGAARSIINAAISKAVADTDDRGEDGKARQVVIKLELKRMDNGMVMADVEAKAMVPAYRTPATVTDFMRIKGESVLVFQEHDAENPDQATFESMDK